MTVAHDTQIIELAEGGLTKQWIDNGSILIFTFYNNQRETIDAWAEAVADLTRFQPSGEAYFILYDASRIFMTPYMRQRSDEIGQIERPDLRGAYAVVLSKHLSGEIIRAYLQRDMVRNYPVHSQFFTDATSALAWLRHMRTYFAQNQG